MTPSQQSALEALYGKPLTAQQVTDLTPLVQARDTGGIAAYLSDGRTKLADVSPATVRGLLYALGKWGGIVTHANACRSNTDASAAGLACQTLYDLAMADQPIPMGNPAINAAVTADLGAMVTAGIITAMDEATVLALASVPDLVSELDVRIAIGG